ncbi:LysM peptidoglycan-binding domain-containing protein [Enterococcus sp. AZ192]|uniref:LysM peptidoglycan-binding domain-containing protein n=1 Tax=unclassified Enterococcus TaxID=2608891 RepID=UPI003D278476
MKKVFMLSIALIALAGCGNSSDKKIDSSSSSKTEQSTSSSTKESSTSISSSSTETSSETSQTAAVLQETQQPESEVVAEEAVPSSEEQPAQSSEPQQYIYDEVQAGEGPNQFAQRNGISLEQLFELNNMDASSGISPGEQLRVK